MAPLRARRLPPRRAERDRLDPRLRRRRAARSSSLQTVPARADGATAENTAAEIDVSPDGRFLYTSNRGDDDLAVFAIDGASLRLAPAGRVPSGGRGPRSFALDPSGRWLVTANQGSGSLVVFRRDPATGLPAAVGAPVAVPEPVCVLFAPEVPGPMTDAGKETGFPWSLFLSEVAGTALLVLGGLTCVILMFGEGSPLPRLLPDVGLRSAITGFLFGTTGALIALSPVGTVSGAHINPAVTFAFWLAGKMSWGPSASTSRRSSWARPSGLFRSSPSATWDERRVRGHDPGAGYGLGTALAGEVVTTFAMVTLLCVFVAYRPLRPFTPGIFPPLFSFMVWAESAVSGTSCNPARSFGPALVSGVWDGWWIYWVGPLLGTFLAMLACSRLAKRIEVAKLYHFETANDRLARRAG